MKGLNMEKIQLTKKNYFGMGMLLGILLIGIIGAVGEYEPAENIFTFISLILMFLFIYTALVQDKIKPIKQFIIINVFIILFCVGADWWWVSLYWMIILLAKGSCMINYINDAKKKDATTKDESKDDSKV
jgi:predicted membrane protein